MSDKLYRVELRYRQPDCCVRNRFYWVQTTVRITAPDSDIARQRALDAYQPSGKTEVLRVTEIINENQD